MILTPIYPDFKFHIHKKENTLYFTSMGGYIDLNNFNYVRIATTSKDFIFEFSEEYQDYSFQLHEKNYTPCIYSRTLMDILNVKDKCINDTLPVFSITKSIFRTSLVLIDHENVPVFTIIPSNYIKHTEGIYLDNSVNRLIFTNKIYHQMEDYSIESLSYSLINGKKYISFKNYRASNYFKVITKLHNTTNRMMVNSKELIELLDIRRTKKYKLIPIVPITKDNKYNSKNKYLLEEFTQLEQMNETSC